MCLGEALAVQAAENGGKVGREVGGEEGIFLIGTDYVGGRGEGIPICIAIWGGGRSAWGCHWITLTN